MPAKRDPPYNAAAAARYLAELQLPLWTDEDLKSWADAHERRERAQSDRDRDAGMTAALDAKQEWNGRAHLVLLRLALSGNPFTSEDITQAVGLPHGGQGMHKNNAVGSLFSSASREGLIRPTGRILRTRNKASHSHMIIEWIGTEITRL